MFSTAFPSSYALKFSTQKSNLKSEIPDIPNSFIENLPIYAPNIHALKHVSSTKKFIREKDNGILDISFASANSNPYLVQKALETLIQYPGELSTLNPYNDAHMLI